MKVEKLGEGEPELAVLYAIHGDEPCGYYATRQIKRNYSNFQKPVKFILANERAFKEGKRYIDEDLNRCFKRSDRSSHEEKVAEKLKEEVKGMNVLDLHASYSHPEPFSIITEKNPESKNLATKIKAENCINLGRAYSSQIENCTRVAAECGHIRSEKAIRNAYRITENFLKAEGVIEGKHDRKKPAIFEAKDAVEGSGYQFLKQNFQKVEKGELYAANGEKVKKAEEDFHPVLMSTNGYEDMIGFKAEKKGRVEGKNA